mgnify:CR=1 FL=1
MTDTRHCVHLSGAYAAGLRRIAETFQRRFLSVGNLLRLLLFLGVAGLWLLLVARSDGDLMATVVLSLVFLVLAVLIFSRSRVGTHYRRMRTLLEWLRICQADSHPATRLLGFVDRAPVASGTPWRQVRSAGGKLKQYYRRRVASLRFGLADGNLLALELVGRAKTKAGQIIAEDYEIRGRLALNDRRYRLPAQEWASNGWRVRPVRCAGRAHLCFWGTLPVHPRPGVPRRPEAPALDLFAPLDRALADIYRRLQRV